MCCLKLRLHIHIHYSRNSETMSLPKSDSQKDFLLVGEFSYLDSYPCIPDVQISLVVFLCLHLIRRIQGFWSTRWKVTNIIDIH